MDNEKAYFELDESKEIIQISKGTYYYQFLMWKINKGLTNYLI